MNETTFKNIAFHLIALLDIKTNEIEQLEESETYWMECAQKHVALIAKLKEELAQSTKFFNQKSKQHVDAENELYNCSRELKEEQAAHSRTKNMQEQAPPIDWDYVELVNLRKENERLKEEINHPKCDLKDQRFDAVKGMEEEIARLKSHVECLKKNSTDFKGKVREVIDDLLSPAHEITKSYAAAKLNNLFVRDSE